MCTLIEHYHGVCGHPVPSTKPPSDHSTPQPETVRQECELYVQNIPCECNYVRATLKGSSCPECEAQARVEKGMKKTNVKKGELDDKGDKVSKVWCNCFDTCVA